MFASQLLRILQTIPSDVKSETCVYESAKENMTMKENQIGMLHDSISFGREADPLAFESEEIYQLNGVTRDTPPSLFEVESRDECWNPKFVNNDPTDNQNENNLVEGDNNYKIALEYKTSELIICKEINYHVVKDICVDEGMPVNNKISTSKADDDDNNCESVGDIDKELPLSNGLETTSLESTEGVSANENGRKEVDGMLLVQGRQERNCSPEEPMPKGETNLGGPHASKEESLVDKTLPIQEFGTRSFLRSFISSLDGEGNRVGQLRNQISSGKVVSVGPSASLGRQEDVQQSSLSYNSKVETESIMFNFNTPVTSVNGNINGKDVGNVKESTGDVLNHKEENSIDHSLNGLLQFASSRCVNSMNSDGKAVNLHVPKLEDSDLDNDSVASIWKYDEGESSFSRTGLDTFSGLISYSGNLSVQSDSSATSGRSFAFPILQSEWKSSPVRMSKADKRHFWKYKGWRSGLLCCSRF